MLTMDHLTIKTTLIRKYLAWFLPDFRLWFLENEYSLAIPVQTAVGEGSDDFYYSYDTFDLTKR